MATSAIKAGEAFVRIFSDDTDLKRGLRGIQAQMKPIGADARRVGAGIAGIGAGIASLGAAGGALLAWPLRLASNMEDTEAAFTTLLKDGEKAKKLLGELEAFAASTPFQFNDLADASKKLLAFGSEAGNVEAELRRIGDVSAAIGAPIGEIAEIYGKARVNGKLFAEDINQLTGRGIPIIQELAKQFGVTDQEVRGLVSDGEVGFENLEKAFADLTTGAGKFAGGMERQSKTLSGAFSTLKDNLQAAFRPFGEVLLPFAKRALTVGTFLVRKFGEFAKANKAIVIPLAAAAASLVAIGAAITALGGAVFVFGAIAGSISAISGAIATIGVPVLVIAAKVILITGAIAAAVLAVGAGFAYVAHKAGLLMPAFNAIKAGVFEVGRIFKTTFGGITAALGSGQFMLAAKIAWAGVSLVTLKATKEVLNLIGFLWKNAYGLTLRFGVQLSTLIARVFSSIPKIAWAALRGGTALSDALQGIIGEAFSTGNLGAGLDGVIANTERRLQALAKQAQGIRGKGQAAAIGGPVDPAGQVAPPRRQFQPSPEQVQAMQMQRAQMQRQRAAAYQSRFRDSGIPTAPPGVGPQPGMQQSLTLQERQLAVLQRIAKNGGLN